MKSLYKRQLAIMVGVMVLSFSLLASAFMMLSYRYIISEKREAMERNAGYITTFTAYYHQQFSDMRDEFYRNYVASIALISDSHVIMTKPDGEIIYATDGVNFYDYQGSSIPSGMVLQILNQGKYTGMTSLSGI